jgi:glutamyl-tRNA reductase
MDELTKQIHESAIILVATNADQPIITATQLINSGTKLIIDLSIPYNVEKSAEDLPNITLINVDALAKIKDETLHKREAEIPKAKNIIAKHIQEFMDWYEMRKNVPVLKAVKHKLEAIESSSLVNTNFSQINTESSQIDATEKIQKVINVLALKMRNQNYRGCNYIEAINEYIAIDSN